MRIRLSRAACALGAAGVLAITAFGPVQAVQASSPRAAAAPVSRGPAASKPSAPIASPGRAARAFSPASSPPPPGGSWKWLNPKPSGTSLFAINCPSTTVCFAAGESGPVLKTVDSGSSWAQLSSFDGVFGISCATVDFCVAVGDGGLATVTADGGASWSSTTINGGQFLSAVSCPATTACFAVGTAGGVFETTNGGTSWATLRTGTEDLLGIDCPSVTVCVAVGNGVALTSAEGWTAYPSQDLFGISCRSTTECLAVGAGGRTMQWLGSGHTWVDLGAGRVDLDGVDCPGGSTYCMAAGADGNVYVGDVAQQSTSSGFQWSPSSVGETGNLWAVDCPDAVTCFAAGDFNLIASTTTGGFTWIPATAGGAFTAMDCFDRLTCTAVNTIPATLASSTDGGDHWTPGPNGPVAPVAISCPSATMCLVVGDNGEVFKTGGPGTPGVEEPPPTSSIFYAVSCASESVCYAVAAQGHIWATADGAASWRELPYPDAGQPVFAIECPSTSKCFTAENRKILVTTDSGAHWTVSFDADKDQSALDTGTFRSLDCPTATTCYAAGLDGMLASTLDGVNWRTDGGFALPRFLDITCPTLDGCFAFGDGSTTMFTSDAGGTWNTQTIGLANYITGWCDQVNECIAAGPGGVALLKTSASAWTRDWPKTSVTTLHRIACPTATDCYATAFDGQNPSGVEVSHDGGNSWTLHSLQHSDQVQGIACMSSSACIATGWPGAIYITPDGGASWNFLANPVAGSDNTLIEVSCPAVYDCYAVGTSGTILHWDGSTWQRQASALTGILYAVSCPSATTCVAMGDAGTSETLSGGVWRAHATGATQILGDLSCPSASACYAVGHQATVMKSVDLGSTWTRLSTGLSSTQTLFSITCPTAAGCIAGGSGGFVVQTEDGGENWVENDPADFFKSTLGVAFTAPNTAWIAGSGGMLMQNTDVFTACLGVSVTTDRPSPQTPGTVVNVTATALGCSFPLFQFWLLAPGASSYSVVQAYSSNDVFTWASDGAKTGTYRINVWVIDVLSAGLHTGAAGSFDAYNANTTFTFVRGCSSVQWSSPGSTGPYPIQGQVGRPIGLTALATCVDPNPLYEFWTLAPGAASYTVAQPYSTSAAFNWETTGLKSGTWRILVWVRDALGTGVFGNSAGRWDAYNANLTVSLSVACPWMSTSGDPVGGAMPGLQVSLVASAPVCTNPEFEFWVLKPGATSYTLLRAYDTGQVYLWDTTGLAVGTYRISVWERLAGTSGRFGNASGRWDIADASLLYKITPGCALVTYDTVSPPATAPRGTSVSINARAYGCQSPLYEYWVLYPGASSYVLKQPYSSASSFAWDTTGLPKGTYRIEVWARDASHAGVYGSGTNRYDAYNASLVYTLS